MNRRIGINLTVFVALAVVMVVWALQNVLTFNWLTDPYPVYADFSSSPGLRAGYEVDYLGVSVGRIGSVKLDGDHVRVRLDIDKGQKLPAGLKAAAARKSAVGEPYVALTPTTAVAVGGPELKRGETIPVSATSVPPSYGALFSAVNKALTAVDPAAVKTLSTEVYKGFNGRADSLRQIIDGSDKITQTFAANDQLIDGLTDSLTKITHVLAQNRGALGQGLDNAVAVTDSLVQVKDQLAQLRDQGPSLLTQVNALLDTTTPNLTCAIQALGGTIPALTTPAQINNLAATLKSAPALVSTLHKVIRKGADGQYDLNILLAITLKTKAAEEFKVPLSQPTVGAVPKCANGSTPKAVAQTPYQGKAPNSVVPSVYATARAANAAASTSPSPSGPPQWLVYIPPVIALLVLLRFAVNALPMLRRRRNRG